MSNPKYASQTYVAPSPDVEVIGEGVLALLRNLHADDIAPFMKQYNLETVEPEKWYPMQLILDIEKAIVEAKINVSETLVAIGVKVMDTVPFVNVNSLEEAISALNIMLKYGMRNAPDDACFYVVTSQPGYTLIVMNLPYPADAGYGYLWALARRFKPADTTFTVKYIENPNPEQFPGIAYEIKWVSK